MQPTEQKPLTAEQVQGSKRPVCVICASEVKVGQNYRDYPSIEHVPLNYCVDALRARVAELEAVIERDRTKLSDLVQAVKKEIRSRSWLTDEGRGCYEWDDDQYKQEFGWAVDAILEKLSGIEQLSSDLSNCPKTSEGVAQARRNYEAELTAERTRREQAEAEAERLLTPLPLDEWHEDTGDVLWWRMPIAEPPYVGSPLCSDWPYDSEHKPHLFWTPLPDCNRIHEAWGAALAGPNPQQSVKNAP